MIRTYNRALKWNIIFRYINISLAFIQGMLLVPLYLNYIPLKVYGLWLATGNLLAWISAIDPGLTVVLNQRVSSIYGKKELKKVGEVIGSGVILSFFVFIISIGFGFALKYILIFTLNEGSIPEESDLLEAFNLAILGSSLLLYSYSFNAINSGLQGSLSIGLINVFSILGSIILNIILLGTGFGLLAIVYALIFSGASLLFCNAIYLYYRLRIEKIPLHLSLEKSIELLKLLSFTFISRITGIVSNNLDLLIVQKFLGPQIVSSIALSRKPIEISREIINQPVVSFQPVISSIYGTGDVRILRKRMNFVITALIWISVVVFGGMIAFNWQFIKLWVGDSVYIGNYYNLLLCIGAYIMVVSQSAGYMSLALGDIKTSSIVGAIQSALNIIFLFVGVKFFGILGLVLAPIISTLITTGFYFPRLVQKRVQFSKRYINHYVYEFFLSVISIFPLIIVSRIFVVSNWLQFICLIFVFITAYFLLLFWFSQEFKQRIVKLLSSIF
jgi:O-antigen/teichoic acid export membrane protein